MRITLAAAIVFGLAFSVSAQAQTVFVYEPVPAEKIAVTASSSFPGFDPENTSNGEGLERHRHRSHNLGNGMWISRTSKHPTQAHANTAKGVVWLLYTLDEPQSVDLVEIWNHNQLNHLNRGLKKVYLQHSIDGENWTSEFRRRYRHTAKWDVFADAVRSGHIGLNASIGNILTGLCKQEELMHLFDDGIAIGRELGVNVNTVMMSDVPGFSWGVVTAMAHNGLKYFSMAPNFVPHLLNGGSRVGLAHIEWADRPFYWQSQSGDDRVGTSSSIFMIL